MSKFKRLLSALVCAAMLMTGPLAVSEEVIGENIPEESIVPQEETAPTPEPEPSEDPTAEPAEEVTPEPTVKPEISFKKTSLEVYFSDVGPGFDHEAKFGLETKGEVGEISWYTSDSSIAAFEKFDKNGDPATSSTPADEITLRLKAYAPGKVTVLAAASGLSAECILTIKADPMEISADKTQAAPGEKIQLTAKVNGSAVSGTGCIGLDGASSYCDCTAVHINRTAALRLVTIQS